MNLIIDIGNTFTHFAMHNGKRLNLTENFRSVEFEMIKRYLTSIMKNQKVEAIGIASVSDKAQKLITHYIRTNFKVVPLIINSKTRLPIRIKIENSHTLGADRICNAVAGNHFSAGKSNVLIADLGTANTFDLVLKNGNFIGGIIAPGILTSSMAMNHNTAKLPFLKYRDLSKNAVLIGTNTFEAIQSGLVNYMKFATEGIVAAVKKKYKGSLRVMLSGGSAKLLINKVNFEYIYKENTVLEGINLIMEHQKKLNKI
ncbi:MAG TPA: type III pantothenate kinase [Ignavibacteria bacterium]|nr:type III pantothenate kinase [Ignavibacteria bacterium]